MTIIKHITSEKQSERLKWRESVANCLWYSGHKPEAEAFFNCGKDEDFRAYAVCRTDASHFAKPILHTCHLRYCVDCERRAMAKRLERFLPAIDDAINSWRKGSYRLRHIVLTTPYDLSKEEILEQYPRAWKAVQKTIEQVMFNVREKWATLEEKRRQRISLKQHGIGLIVGAEFGEQGHKLHFHLLCYCPYIPHDTLTKYWKENTNQEAYISDIKQVHSIEQAAKETITKYVTKLSDMPPELIPCLHKVLEGSRRIRSYGIFYNLPALEEEPCTCPQCGSSVGYMRRSDYEERYGKKVLTNCSSNTGNKSGEKITSLVQLEGGILPPLPPPIPRQRNLIGFNDESLYPAKKDTTYSQ